jgi:hypothetical protein
MWVVAPLPPVSAQIPRETVRRGVLTPEDKTLIKTEIAKHLPSLASQDQTVMKRGREVLLAPFGDQEVSVAFRQYFSQEAMPELRKLAAHESDRVIVNALRVAGEMATSDGTALLEQKLGDKKEAIRFAAVNGLERTMSALANRASAIPEGRIQQIIETLGTVVGDPKSSPDVIWAGAKALFAALNVNAGNARSLAAQALSSSIGKVAVRYGSTPTPERIHQVFLRAGETARGALAVPGAAGVENAKEAAALGGHLLSWSYCQVRSGQLPNAQDREVASGIVSVAEQVIILAAEKAGVRVAPANLAADFKQLNDNNFIRNLSMSVLPVLTGPPFNLPEKSFLNCKPPP